MSLGHPCTSEGRTPSCQDPSLSLDLWSGFTFLLSHLIWAEKACPCLPTPQGLSEFLSSFFHPHWECSFLCESPLQAWRLSVFCALGQERCFPLRPTPPAESHYPPPGLEGKTWNSDDLGRFPLDRWDKAISRQQHTVCKTVWQLF